MKSIKIKSFAKINLSLDILGRLENGYHRVDMIMHQTELHDDVTVKLVPSECTGDTDSITVFSDDPFLPDGKENTAYRAAALMKEKYGSGHDERIKIEIAKRVPVAAGLAGGSGNGAAVLHALNTLWGLGLSLRELCAAGAVIGSDVPFSAAGQARENSILGTEITEDPLASSCVRATGTGTDIEPLPPLESFIVLSRPPVEISTKDSYGNFVADKAAARPGTERIVQGLRNGDFEKVRENMANVLEKYALTMYDEAMYTKNKMEEVCDGGAVMMSGSGPTIYALLKDEKEASYVYNKMKGLNRETFLTKTTM